MMRSLAILLALGACASGPSPAEIAQETAATCAFLGNGPGIPNHGHCVAAMNAGYAAGRWGTEATMAAGGAPSRLILLKACSPNGAPDEGTLACAETIQANWQQRQMIEAAADQERAARIGAAGAILMQQGPAMNAQAQQRWYQQQQLNALRAQQNRVVNCRNTAWGVQCY